MIDGIKAAARWSAAALLLAAGAARAETVDFSLSDDSFRFGLVGPLSRIVSNVQGQYDLGFIKRERHGDDTYAGHVGALISGDMGLQDIDVTAGAGLRAVFIGGDGDNGGALAPGLQAEARVPGVERVGVLGYAYYAPSVVSFDDIDSYRDLGAAVSYQLVRSAALYVGYRNIRIGVEHGPNVTLDSGFFGGLSLTF